MELVVTKDSLSKYFDLLTPRHKSEKEKLLQSTIERQENRLKISSEFLNVLEEYFEAKGPNYLQFFQTFITNANSENRLITFKNSSSQNENEIISTCFNHNYEDYSFIISFEENDYLENNHSNNTSIISNVDKPNKHWVIANLAAGNTLDIDHNHFPDDNSIYNFVALLPKMSKKVKKIEFIDSYFNTGNNNLVYTTLKISKSKVKCYTRLQNNEDIDFKRRRIKDFFGPRKTSVFFTRDITLSHPRKISIGDLVVELTHDFTQIQPRNNNWGFYLKICHDKRRDFENMIINYN